MWTDTMRGHVSEVLKGKRIALVGSGPGALGNAPGFVDSHDVVVRVNNYKLTPETGSRTDVYYSFFGKSIRKSSSELIRDGVKLCMCKCPAAKFIESEWHERNGKFRGVDFRPIYEERSAWWFCATYVPPLADFLGHFELLQKHVPTTGFAALLDVLSFEPRHVFLTGFDFFQSAVHNLNEGWAGQNLSDPIGHRNDIEREWLATNLEHLPLTMDAMAYQALRGDVKPQWKPRTKQQRIMEKRRAQYKALRGIA